MNNTDTTKNTNVKTSEYQSNMHFKVIRSLITVVIIAVSILFFIKIILREIKRICPEGSHSALGGRRNRNFWTLKTDILIILCWAIVVPFNGIISAQNETIRQYIGMRSNLYFFHSLSHTGSCFFTFHYVCFICRSPWTVLPHKSNVPDLRDHLLPHHPWLASLQE